MDLVDLMYRYINKFINSKELLKKLKKIDLTKYPLEEVQEIEQLILDVKDIINNTPNEIDEEEKERLAHADHLLESLESIRSSSGLDDKTRKTIEKQYNKIAEDKKVVRDGGKLYADLFDLLTKHLLVCNYAMNMNDEELLDFITNYIYAPIPPAINQDGFNDLVGVGIKKDRRRYQFRRNY